MAGPVLEPGLYGAVVTQVKPAEMCVDVDVDSLGFKEEITNVPILQALGDPQLRGGTFALPKIGTSVIMAVTNDGHPFIQGCLNTFNERADLTKDEAEREVQHSGVDLLERGQETFGFSYVTDDPIFKNVGEESYRQGRPPEVLPGDWVQYGTDGNLLGVLGGGVTVMKASDTAQIQAFKHSGKIKIAARKFELYTDFGEMVFFSDKGSASFKLRGSVSTEKAHPKEFSPDCFIEFGSSKYDDKGNLTSAGGDPYLKIGTSDIFLEFKNGKVTPGGEAFARANASAAAPLQDKIVNIDANLKQSIEGSAEVTSEKELLVSSSTSSVTAKSGSSFSVSSGSTLDISCQGRRADVIYGWANPVKDGPPTPSKVAYDLSVINGDMVIDVGDKLLREVSPGPSAPVFTSAFRLNTYEGDIKMACYGVGNSIVLSAPTPPSKLGASPTGHGIVLDSPMVLLGNPAVGVPNPPHPLPGKPAVPQPLVMWPGLYAWMTTISTQVQTLATALGGHTHPGHLTPDPISTPLLQGVAPAVSSATAAVTAAAMSKTVYAGG